MEGKEEGEKRQGKEEKWGWVGGISLGEWCYTTVCAYNTDHLLYFCSPLLSPPSLPFRAGCVMWSP